MKATLGPQITEQLLQKLLRYLPGSPDGDPNWQIARNELCIFKGVIHEDTFRHGDSHDALIPPKLVRVHEILWKAAEPRQ